MDLNRVSLIGHVARGPQPEADIATFTLATSIAVVRAGERRQIVQFHTLVARGTLAVVVARYLTRGTKVYIEGSLTTRPLGGRKAATYVEVENLILLAARREAA